MTNAFTKKSEEYYNGVRQEMLSYVPLGIKKVLEIGCGEGNFGALLKNERDLEVWGIEFQLDKANVAARKLDKVLCGDVAVLLKELPNGYFDAVVCNDVLEHLTDPYSALDGLKQKLTEEGVVVSSLPNIRYHRNFFDLIFGRNWDYATHGVMDVTHLRFFTINSIRTMYESLGYEIIRHEGINPTSSLRPWPLIILSLGYFSDVRYLQFATVATPVALRSDTHSLVANVQTPLPSQDERGGG